MIPRLNITVYILTRAMMIRVVAIFSKEEKRMLKTYIIVIISLLF